MPDERSVGEHGAIAPPAGPHDEIVLLVVAPAIDFIEPTELRQDYPADQDAEPVGRRDIAERRQPR